MKYTYHCKEYIEQLKLNNELEKMTFSSTDSKEYIISKLEERSAKKREIANIANTIIREYIEPYEKNIDLLTDDVANDLEEFSLLLFPDGAQTGNVTITDYAVIYRIEKILASYYKKTGNINKFVLAVNRRSLGYLLLFNEHSYTVKESPFKEDAFELLKYLDSDILDEKARSKLLIAIAREVIPNQSHFPTTDFEKVFDILMKYTSTPPTEKEIMNQLFFVSVVMQVLREHSFWAIEANVPFDVEGARSICMKSYNFMKEQMKKYPELATYADFIVDTITTDFLLGNISYDEVLSKLLEAEKEARNDPNPFAQAMGLGKFNNLYLKIIYRYSTESKEEINRISKERIDEVLPSLVNVTRQVNNAIFNSYIVEFLNAASLTGTFDDYYDIILGCTVYADKALFIHTAMVKEMSCVIFDYMIENNPEFFVGVADWDLDYIKNHKDSVKKLLSDCAMFHDIGKFFMLDVVENSMRRLSDDEFEIIKDHPTNFGYIFVGNDSSDERLECIHDCALTHHLWHDGTRGYPNVKHTKNRPFSDILAIADSIDAATDFFGRPYNIGKTIDGLLEEFIRDKGTKYGEEVVDAISNPEVKDKLQYLITEGRKDIYYKIYAFNKL